MNLSGLVKSTLIDYPGRVAAVVFTQGCNFRCGFCHNPDLIPGGEGTLSEIEFFEFLNTRAGKLDGVVVTGGEPTIQEDLPNFLSKIKEHEFSVKLDTNGSNPAVLSSLIAEGLIDFVAMDIKGDFDDYSKIAHYSDVENIKRSIEIIKKSDIPYEFRTTALPRYHKVEEFEKLGRILSGAKRYAVQGFRDENVFDKTLMGSPKFSSHELATIAAIMRRYVDDVVIRENG
jgi:pyruvate formate lyase activating enzyme